VDTAGVRALTVATATRLAVSLFFFKPGLELVQGAKAGVECNSMRPVSDWDEDHLNELIKVGEKESLGLKEKTDIIKDVTRPVSVWITALRSLLRAPRIGVHTAAASPALAA
jgi:hypothetical protein